MTRTVYTITDRPGHPKRHMDARAIWRGLVAVAVLLLTAADALITAVVGIPPIACTVRRLAGAYREAYHGSGPQEPPAVITVTPEPHDTNGGA